MPLLSPSSETEEEDKCYRFELLESPHGLFDSLYEESIEATYIIHWEGKGCLKQVKAQLETFRPTRKIYLLHHQVYQKCEKTPDIDKLLLEVVDANLRIFQHAQKRGYGNILVLEDDFQFNTQILLPEHRDEVASFLTEHKNEDFLYKLGCLPIFMIPTDIYMKHYLVGIGMGMHAVVYSRKLRERILKTNGKQLKDWNRYHSLYSRSYTYDKPLCYQLFPSTENQKQWETDDWYSKPFVLLGSEIIKALNLDTQIEPGYSYFYSFSKFLVGLLILLMILILWCWVLVPLFSPVFRWWWKGGKEKKEEEKK